MARGGRNESQADKRQMTDKSFFIKEFAVTSKPSMLRTILKRINRAKKKLIARLSPTLASKLFHKKRTGQSLNLDQPASFSEKCHWLKLFWQHPLVAKCADKYEVREWITECGCEDTLNELYGVYEDVSEIDWESLPRQFALKASHGYGFNIICDDKDKLDREEVLLKAGQWLKTTYGVKTVELQYWKMKPRIICERFIQSSPGRLPVDYKFFCFYGKVHCVMVCSGRKTKSPNFDFFDREWKTKLDYDINSTPDHVRIAKPASYEKMVEVAEKVSKPFPFVRVDFYDVDGKAVFGEMTFTPMACSDPDMTAEANETMGRLLKLPEEEIL